MYLIYDTETTGLPRDWNAPLSDLDNWPRCVQLSWQLHGPTGELLEAGNHIIKPEGFTIPYNAEKVHGISTDRALREGDPLAEVLTKFNETLGRAQVVVGHNIEFDINIMAVEYLRARMETPLQELPIIDTKEESTDFCAIPGGKGGKYKWPKLTELHIKLFGVGFGEAHNAAFDVDATARCFFGLMDHRVIRPLDGTALSDIRYEAPDLSGLAIEKTLDTEVKTSAPIKEATAADTLPYAALHVHSQYTILQSASTVKSLVKKAKESGMTALALTDRGCLMGMFEAVSAGEKEEVKIIAGMEAVLAEDHTITKFTKDSPDRRHFHVLLAENQLGYKNLCKLSSLGYLEGMYMGLPRIDKPLIEKYKEGLFAFSGGLYGEIADLLLNVGEEQAEEALTWWRETFPGRFYLELQDHGQPEERRLNEALVAWSKKYNLPLIATHASYYTEPDDAEVQEVLLCVKDGMPLSAEVGFGRSKRTKLPTDLYHLRTPAEMSAVFKAYPEAVENAAKLAALCETPKVKREVQLPNFKLPEGFTTQDDYLRHLTYLGAEKRYPELTEEIRARLDFELKIIAQMGFAGYFLIVQDFTGAARKMGVSVGPGRGSAAGSAVAYCVGITNIDPIGYKLLFERFLNPERVSMPDIDIDFDDEGRSRVIDYCIETYGKNQVAQIITYGTMAARSALRDVGRVLELPLPETDALAKLFPATPGMTFTKAFSEFETNEEAKKKDKYHALPNYHEQIRQLIEVRDADSLHGKVLRLAEKMEGTLRNVGIHAAGVIIAPDDITEFIPACTAKDADLLVTQFEGKVVEDAGMLKMDFLGLKTLSIISRAIRLIEERHGVKLDPDTLPLDDEKTLKLYQQGSTIGTFQFESEGMQMYLRQLEPTSIEDLIAMNALYRPGPMQFIETFIRRKHGKEPVEYPHDLLEPILKDTYGIMVYQEQIMQAAQILGGYTLGGADLLRRAMGKKKMDVMEEQRAIFTAGCKEHHGIEAKKANEVFDIMMKFAEYGFNRSHSAAYSVVAFQTAYLKANYPAEYMAAVLSANSSSIEKLTFFMDECRRIGVKTLGPHVNESQQDFSVNEEGQIRFGMAAIKGTGDSAILSLIEERDESGPFQDLFDLVRRIDLRAVNKKSLEVLTMAGAFDDFLAGNRARLIAEDPQTGHTALDALVQYGARLQSEADSNQQSLFGESSTELISEPQLPEIAPWPSLHQLKVEREVVGVYLSGHPLDPYRIEMEHFCTCGIAKVDEHRDRQVSLAGIVAKTQERIAKNGNPFGILTLEDYTGTTEMMIFGEEYLKHRHMMSEGQFLFIEGFYRERRNRFGGGESSGVYEFKPQTFHLLSEVRDKLGKGIEVRLQAASLSFETIDQLELALAEANGSMELRFVLLDKDIERPLELYGRRKRISLTDPVMAALSALPGSEVKIRLN